MWLICLGIVLQRKRPVQFLIRTYAWVAGLVPSWGSCETLKNYSLFFLDKNSHLLFC